MKRSAFLISLATLALLLVACSAFQTLRTAGAAPASVPTTAPSLVNHVSAEQEQTLVELYRRANPAVVNITTYFAQPDPGGAGAQQAQGSGYLYDGQGRIITNNHVVEDAARVEVTFSDGSTQKARILGVDPGSDLAVLQVDKVPAGIQSLPLGDSEALQVGQSVAAIGNPFGLEGTLTTGVVSSLGRVISSGLTRFSIPEVIQTDAAINPGNSGGPLLTLNGEVVGVNSQIVTSDGVRANSGVGFAIPASIIRKVAPSLIAEGSYAWPWLGVRGGTVSSAIAQANNLGDVQGAYIAEALPGGPAADAGLRGADREVQVDGIAVPVGGDVIQAVDQQAIRSFDELLEYVAVRSAVGQTVELTILRDGRARTVVVKLEARPAEVNP